MLRVREIRAADRLVGLAGGATTPRTSRTLASSCSPIALVMIAACGGAIASTSTVDGGGIGADDGGQTAEDGTVTVHAPRRSVGPFPTV